jgi:hypothetical protein
MVMPEIGQMDIAYDYLWEQAWGALEKQKAQEPKLDPDLPFLGGLFSGCTALP